MDCIALDDGLVQYLIDVLKQKDWQEFYKLSQITTKLDLDPNEFLYWLGTRSSSPPDEQACASIMDACLKPPGGGKEAGCTGSPALGGSENL